jgi:hypothetical protein
MGNRGTTRLLARKGPKNKGTYENSVQVGKLGPIEITESNLAEWTKGGTDAPDVLTVTSVKGKHSDDLKKLSDSRERVDTIKVAAVTGQNSWIVITISHARIKGYEADADGKHEHWTIVDFDAVHKERTSIGVPRP